MKKHLIIRAILALACAMTLASACNSEKPLGQVTVSIDKVALYDELGITDLMNDKAIGWDNVFIVDSLLIYNEEGTLVTELGEVTEDLNPLILEIPDLPDGRYTFVAWQSADNHLEHSSGPCWAVQDRDLLSTVSITTPYAMYHYPYALGYATAVVAVHGGNTDVELKPRSMGCIVDVWVDHFAEDAGPVRMILETTDKGRCVGIRLDPALDEADRWVYLEAYGPLF